MKYRNKYTDDKLVAEFALTLHDIAVDMSNALTRTGLNANFADKIMRHIYKTQRLAAESGLALRTPNSEAFKTQEETLKILKAS